MKRVVMKDIESAYAFRKEPDAVHKPGSFRCADFEGGNVMLPETAFECLERKRSTVRRTGWQKNYSAHSANPVWKINNSVPDAGGNWI